MVNSLLRRVHLSGRLDQLSKHQHKLISDGMTIYKQIRDELRHGVPFWPLGLPSWDADWIALGIDCGNNRYVSVWRRGGDELVLFPSVNSKERLSSAECL